VTRVAIDMGNTRTKVGWFRERELVKHMIVPTGEWRSVVDEITAHPPEQVLLIGSSECDALIAKDLSQSVSVIHWKDFPDVKLPFSTRYLTPETIGKDRLACVAGASSKVTAGDFLVISFGTCITYDLMIGGIHLGGAITPGMMMRFSAMHDSTGKLPFVSHGEFGYEFPGLTTGGALTAGVVQGIVNEAIGFIEDSKHYQSGINVIITGGDASAFAPLLKYPIFAHPFLTLEGLNDILIYQG
jgi:type III pantothenate kinase